MQFSLLNSVKCCFFLVVITWLILVNGNCLATTLQMAVPKGVINRYQTILRDTGNHAEELHNLHLKRSNKSVVSLVIIKQALALEV